MKPKPTSSMQRATALGSRSIRAPSASSRSAEPESPVAERFPCLATTQPAPAAISAAVVETLNVRRPPPVPAVSSRSSCSTSTRVAKDRIAWASPASSSTVSPLVRSAIRKAAIWISVALPAIISASTSAVCSWVRSRRSASASMARVRRSALIRRAIPGEEVDQELPALLGEDRLGMKLDPLGRQLAVAHRHHHAVALGALLQSVGQLGVDDQRVVAAHLERAGQAPEDRPPV